MECLSKFAKIVPGSKAVFDLVLRKLDKTPFNLAPYTSGKLIFVNTKGVRTEITLTVPGTNPGAGIIQVTISSVQAGNADAKWKDADLVLNDGTDDKVLVLNDKFEIVERNAPPVVP